MSRGPYTDRSPGHTKNWSAIKGSRSALYFYLRGITLAAMFIIPAALIQTFVILDASVILEGTIQWGIFLMPMVVITIAGLLIGRIMLLSDLLEQSNHQQQRELLNNTSSVVYIKDMQGRYTFINRKFEELFQLKEQDLSGKTDYDILPKELADAFRENDKMVVTAGKTLEFDEVVKLDDGDHTYISVKFPLKNTAGEIYATCGISTDITERINMEEALRRSQKMDAIGQLSGGIAHDFNNQLGVILGYLEMLENNSANDEKSLKWITTASNATQRCVNLTQQLLVFSRKKAKHSVIVNLNETFKDMDNMLAHSITPEVEIEYFLADNLSPVETDIGEFQDVVLNLVINARDAMPNGGKLIIETGNKIIDTDFANLHQIKPGQYVQIRLSDNGVGMDKETQEHMYEPFYTTKPEGNGTGLGLAMVYGFAERFDGYIQVYSELGIGTSIQLYLPTSSAAQVTTDSGIKEPEMPTGNETILVVDDEADLLQLACQYLSELGYHVYPAENAAKALETMSEKTNIDMLFSDVVMPGGTNGYQLAQQATQQRPELKVLLTSGFTSNTITQNGQATFTDQLLNKPYRKAELAQWVRRVLDASPKQ